MASEAVNKLNKLIKLCEDGKTGYEKAAGRAEDPQLRSLFEQNARQRAQFTNELQQTVRQLGGEPVDHGSASGSVHQAWLGLRDALTGGDEAILRECIRGDEYAVKEYGEVAEDTDDVPSEALSVVNSQQAAINDVLSRLHQMERAHA